MALVCVWELWDFRMKLRIGAQDVVEYSHVVIAEVLRGLYVITERPKIISNFGHRQGNSNFHTNLLLFLTGPLEKLLAHLGDPENPITRNEMKE